MEDLFANAEWVMQKINSLEFAKLPAAANTIITAFRTKAAKKLLLESRLVLTFAPLCHVLLEPNALPMEMSDIANVVRVLQEIQMSESDALQLELMNVPLTPNVLKIMSVELS